MGELKRNEINLKRMKSNNDLIVNKIEYDFDDINKRINNIVQGGKKNDKEIYSISKDNIAKIISEKKNESKLRNLNIDYNSMIIEYQNLLNILEVNINKKYQLDEKLNMLKEEKNMMEDKIIENISKKESFKEVSKIYLLKFINEIFYRHVNESRNDEINNNNNFELSNGAHSLLLNNKNYGANNNFNISNENLIIYSYELNNIDINKLCFEMATQLISSISNYLKNSMSKSNYQYNKNNNNLNMNNNPFNDSKIIYNSKENISLIEIMSSKVKKEILNFINYSNENNAYDFQSSINDFFFELSKSTIKYLNYFFNSQLKIKEENIFLLIYLKLLFKKIYLDKVIQNECDFLNNQYKKNKKNIKKCLELAIASIHKLNEKKKKYDVKLNEIKQKKQLSQEQCISDKVHTSLKDKAYFDLTKKSNDIIQNKEDINNDFDLIEKEYQQRNQNLNKNILNKEKEIKNLEKNKKILEEKMAKKNKVIMIEIAKLKKIITNKFKLIRAQIDIYKKKYGNNNDLYDKFFKNESKHPRFKSKRRGDFSFYQDPCKIQITTTHVKLESIATSKRKNKQKLNWFRLAERGRIPLGVKYENPRITFDGLNWWLSVSFEFAEPKPAENCSKSLGIDLGIKNLAVCSDGKIYPNINRTKTVRRLKKRQRRLQRSISRKFVMNKEGESYRKTRNIIKSEKLLLKIHHRLKNIRQNYRHQIKNEIIRRKPRLIVLEDLNVRGMMTNRHLAKAVQEHGFYEFRRQIEYKAQWAGIQVIIADRYYPSSKKCINCGNVKKDLKLSERIYHCKKCGNKIDRDLQAAINLKRYIPVR